MEFEGSPEPIDFDFFDDGPTTRRSGRSVSPDFSNRPPRPQSGKRSGSSRAYDGDHDRDSVRSVTSSRSSVSVRIPTATPTHDDGNEADRDYYSDDFDDSDKDISMEKGDGTFRFKEDISALKDNSVSGGRGYGKGKAKGNGKAGPGTSESSKNAARARPKTSVGRRRQRSRSNSSSSCTSTDSTASDSSSFTSESDKSSRSEIERDNESVTSVSPLQSPASSPIPKLEYDEQEMERETEKLRSVRFLEEDEIDHRDAATRGGNRGTRSGKGRPKSSKARPHSSPVKTPGYSNYRDDPPLRATEANELSMLLRAVLEMDENTQSSDTGEMRNLKKPLSGKRRNRPQSAPTAAMPQQRMNLSFSNDEVRRIDRENRRLLEKIVGRSSQVPAPVSRTANHRPTSHSAVKRQREQRRIEIENMQILKRIEAARANPQIKRESQLEDFHQQRRYASQVAKAPGGLGSRPTSAKRAGKGYGGGGMAKASSMSSLGTDYTVDTVSSSSTGRSRPRSAKWGDGGTGGGYPRAAKPAWDDRFYLNQ